MVIDVFIVIVATVWLDLLLSYAHYERTKDGNTSFVVMLWLSAVTPVLVTLLLQRLGG